jgi:polyisoprenoid-binding protein YceI
VGTEADRFRLVGTLTLHGVERELVLDVGVEGRTRDPWGNDRAGFSARASIVRRDFGLVWNQLLEAGGLIVGERVDLESEIEAVRQSAEKAA